MKRHVLKAVSIALVLALMLPVSACNGSKDPTGGSETEKIPGVAEINEGLNYTGIEDPDYPRGTTLFPISKDFAKAQLLNNVMSYINQEGQIRTEILGRVDRLKTTQNVDLMMAIGELRSCNIQTSSTTANSTFSVNLFIAGSAADYKVLVDRYKAFNGFSKITFESPTSIIIAYSWGTLNTCRFSEDLGLIQVSFSVNAAALA